MKFTELNLPDYVLKSVEMLGFTDATEIQEKSIPIIRNGQDLIGLSQTGSGKTFAYGIPAIIGIDEDIKAVQALIICPTRELVLQVCDELRKISSQREGAKIVPIYGGSNMDRQITAIKKGAKIVIGTPGRLMDHLNRKTLKLHELKLLVLDEADEMLNMGFREDIETILKSTNKEHQTVMYSATMPKPILELTSNYMIDPITIKSAVQDKAQSFINQFYCTCKKDDKIKALEHLLKEFNPTTAIIFCNTKAMVDKLNNQINELGFETVALHGDLRQSERKRIMEKIKKENKGILIATDVAARGIDIKNVDIVFNFDLPRTSEYYIHRIGRTGRAGKEGKAISLINTKQNYTEMLELTKETKNIIEEIIIKDISVNYPDKSVNSSNKNDTKKDFKAKSNKKYQEKDFSKSRNNQRDFDFKDDKNKKSNQRFGDKKENTFNKFSKNKSSYNSNYKEKTQSLQNKESNYSTNNEVEKTNKRLRYIRKDTNTNNRPFAKKYNKDDSPTEKRFKKFETSTDKRFKKDDNPAEKRFKKEYKSYNNSKDSNDKRLNNTNEFSHTGINRRNQSSDSRVFKGKKEKSSQYKSFKKN